MLSRRLLLAAKLVFSAALIGYVAGKIDFETAVSHLQDAAAPGIALVIALLYAQLVLGALRFREFLSVFGVRFTLGRSLDALLIGYFFSQTFISFLGGDAMRLMRTAGAGVPAKTAAKALILDRGSGFFAQLLLIVLVLPFLLPRVPDAHMKASLVLLVIAACSGAVAVLLLARLPGALRRFKALEAVADVSTRVLRRVGSARGLAALLGYSMAISLMNIVIFYAIARGLSVDIAFVDCLVLLPVVFFLSMLPISVSGWGVREGAAVVALGLAGIPSTTSLTISVSYGLALVLISLPGGVLWLFAKRRHEMPAATGSEAALLEPGHAKD